MAGRRSEGFSAEPLVSSGSHHAGEVECDDDEDRDDRGCD
jgi:hypothetical protein